MPTILIPPPFRGPSAGAERIEVSGARVGECLRELVRIHPGFGELLFADDGRVQRFVGLFVNGAEIPREALDTALDAADELEILAAIAGG